MISRPDEVYTNGEVAACTREVLKHHPSGPPMAQPTRQELLAALAK